MPRTARNPARVTERLSTLDSPTLARMVKQLRQMPATEYTVDVRLWVLRELSHRDPAAFGRYIASGTKDPTPFF